ncbi:MAG: succinate dehydrogenase, hydrophobic membrane anchor protein [Pseudomonadota bacterium]
MKNNLKKTNDASSAWLAQRISAVALFPLLIWFVYFIFVVAEYRDFDLVISMFASPFIVLFLAFFINVGLYHGYLGVKEIIEDYVHCQKAKISLILMFKFITIISAVAGICSILVLHLSTFNID